MGLPKGSLNLMLRANEQVPHGGAKKMPTTSGDLNHVNKMLWCSGKVRSSSLTVVVEFLTLWSMPNEPLIPKDFKLAVTRPLPQKISTTRGQLSCSAVNSKLAESKLFASKLGTSATLGTSG